MRVLVADDQPHIRSALRLLLDHEPDLTVVGEAVDLPSLCAQIQVTQPEILLLDWELPGWPETDFLAVLRFLYPKLLIIALSGQLDAREAALAAGVDFFISKSYPPEQLLSTLRAIRHCYNGYNGKEPTLLKKERMNSRVDKPESINRGCPQPQASVDEERLSLPFPWCKGQCDLDNSFPSFWSQPHRPEQPTEVNCEARVDE